MAKEDNHTHTHTDIYIYIYIYINTITNEYEIKISYDNMLYFFLVAFVLTSFFSFLHICSFDPLPLELSLLRSSSSYVNLYLF